MAVLGSLVLAISPFFVRLAWPTRSLPQGRFAAGLNTPRTALGFVSLIFSSGIPGT